MNLPGAPLLMIRSIESTQSIYSQIFHPAYPAQQSIIEHLNPPNCSCPTQPNELLERTIEATDEDLQDYKEKLFALLKSSDELDDKCRTSTRDLLQSMRVHILAKSAEITKRAESNHEPSWGSYWTRILIHEFNQVITKFEGQFHEHLDSFRIKAFDVGVDLADNGFDYASDKAGLDIGRPQFILGSLKLDTESLKIQAGFTADLISRMTTQQIEDVSKEIRNSMALGESPTKLQAKLAAQIDSGPWRTTKIRAEAITRTEVSRVQELGCHQRALQQQRFMDEGNSGLRLRRQFLCAPILGWPCPRCRIYDGLVFDAVTGDPYKHEPAIHPEIRKGLKGNDLNGSARGEHSPNIPVHVNCRCVMTPWIDVDDVTTRKIVAAAEDVVEATVKWNDHLHCYVFTINSHPYPSKCTTQFSTESDLHAWAINQLKNQSALNIPEEVNIGSLKVVF